MGVWFNEERTEKGLRSCWRQLECRTEIHMQENSSSNESAAHQLHTKQSLLKKKKLIHLLAARLKRLQNKLGWEAELG